MNFQDFHPPFSSESDDNGGTPSFNVTPHQVYEPAVRSGRSGRFSQNILTGSLLDFSGTYCKHC